ncbi:MAG: hypothetical protein GJ680_09640 [Alteromonadaceae bacterium]|nr:hypothetical protein [Alteromonadaceae bacterium]
MPLIKTFVVLGLLVLLYGCVDDTTSAPSLNFNYAKTPIVLTEHVQGDWETVCILGPYSNNELAAEVIGFTWPLETLSSVRVNDGVSLLIFIKNKAVQSYFEVSRGKYDFNSLDEQCINRNEAIFTQANGQVVVSAQV